MLTAFSSEKSKVVLATDVVKSNGPFYCSVCKEEVNVKKGYVRKDHFSHLKNSLCIYKGESPEHLRIKYEMYEMFKKDLGGLVNGVFLEKNLPGCRPDVLIEGRKKKIAVEIQASSIVVEELIRRTIHYTSMDIYVLWVLPYRKSWLQEEWDAIQGEFKYIEVKLKEYERAIFYMYFKNLIFWNSTDYERPYFQVIKFDDSWTEGSEYYNVDYHETVFHYAKKKLSLKIPTRVAERITIKDLEPNYAKAFKMPNKNYYLPIRKIINYRW